MIELPPELGGPSAWYGPDIAHRDEWLESLSPAELAEMEIASQRLAKPETDWQSVRKHDFPLPTLQGRLTSILDEVLQGRGFVLCAVCRSNDGAGGYRPLPSWDSACTGEACARKTGTGTFWVT